MGPIFTVSDITDEHALKGSVDRTVVTTKSGSHQWVGDGQPGFLRHNAAVYEGRWHTQGELWNFVPVIRITDVQSEYGVLDYYWGERARLTLDPQLVWTKQTWRDSHDHDHCALCWQTIGPGGTSAYYDHGEIDRVCLGCYESFVEPHDISFIPELR